MGDNASLPHPPFRPQVQALAILSDGGVVTGADDTTVKVWRVDPVSGVCVGVRGGREQ